MDFLMVVLIVLLFLYLLSRVARPRKAVELPIYLEYTISQVLESVHIIMYAQDIDTIKERYLVFISRAETLKVASKKPKYADEIKKAIVKYEALYHSRPLTERQIAAVTEPNEVNLDDLYCLCLLDCANRNKERYYAEIAALVRNNAKQRRYDKIHKLLSEIKAELTARCANTPSYHKMLERLNDIGGELS
jgi:hypothetical protein